MGMVLDRWQEEVLGAEGNICLCSGRQVGKSEIIALKVARFIVVNPKKRVLVVSVTEDQAELMLQKIIGHLFDIDKKLICKGAKRPTKHRVELLNGAFAVTKALGSTGAGLRGGTFDVIVPDECAYFPESVWSVLSPMILTTGGCMWLLSTPNAQEGYFYHAYTNPDFGFKTFHVTSEEVAEGRPEPLRSIMLAHLAREKVRMSPLEYAQQYNAQFMEDLSQFFKDDLILNAQTLERTIKNERGEFYCGLDVARLGGDETVFTIFEKLNKKYFMRDCLIYKYTLTTETNNKLVELNNLYNFKEIYIDSAGLGVAIADFSMFHPSLKNKTVQIDNATRSVSPDKNRTRKLLKEDLYFNTLAMIERGEVELLKDPEIFRSFKSIMIEHDVSRASIKIYGRYSHICESVIRGLWSNHSTRLSLWVR